MRITIIWPGRFSTTTFTNFFSDIPIYKLIMNLVSYKNAKESTKWSFSLINYKLVKLIKQESMMIMSHGQSFYLGK